MRLCGREKQTQINSHFFLSPSHSFLSPKCRIPTHFPLSSLSSPPTSPFPLFPLSHFSPSLSFISPPIISTLSHTLIHAIAPAVKRTAQPSFCPRPGISPLARTVGTWAKILNQTTARRKRRTLWRRCVRAIDIRRMSGTPIRDPALFLSLSRGRTEN